MKLIYTKSIDSNYETWPELLKVGNHIYCIYSETIEEGKRVLTSLNCDYSTDGGDTWKTSRHPIVKYGVPFWHKVKFLKNDLSKKTIFTVLSDNTAGYGEIVYFSFSEELGWSEVNHTGIFGILSGSPIVLGDGRIIILVHKLDEDTGYFRQHVWYSDDFRHWNKSQNPLTLPNCSFLDSEVIMLEEEKILMLLRENSPTGWDLYKSISEDHGCSWSLPEKVPFRGGQNPCVGTLGNNLLITFSKDTAEKLSKSVAITTVEKKQFLENHKKAKFNIIADDLNGDYLESQSMGYSSWISVNDNTILVSEYILKGIKGLIKIKEITI